MVRSDTTTDGPLQYGLFGGADASAASGPAAPVDPLRSGSGAWGQPADEAASWSDRDADELRDALLQQTLLTIQDGRSSPQTIEECWAWLMSDREGGFSFVTCAREAGCDPTVLREVFEAQMRRHGRVDGPGEGQLALTRRPWEWLEQAR